MLGGPRGPLPKLCSALYLQNLLSRLWALSSQETLGESQERSREGGRQVFSVHKQEHDGRQGQATNYMALGRWPPSTPDPCP